MTDCSWWDCGYELAIHTLIEAFPRGCCWPIRCMWYYSASSCIRDGLRQTRSQKEHNVVFSHGRFTFLGAAKETKLVLSFAFHVNIFLCDSVEVSMLMHVTMDWVCSLMITCWSPHSFVFGCPRAASHYRDRGRDGKGTSKAYRDEKEFACIISNFVRRDAGPRDPRQVRLGQFPRES